MSAPRWLLFALFVSAASSERLYLNGDVIVEGLFQIWEPEETDGMCPGSDKKVLVESVMHAEAVKWYFNQLNSQPNQKLKIGLRGHETCGQSSTAAERTVDILHNALVAENNSSEIVIGVLGPELSSEASVVSNMLSSVSATERLLQVGFSTTAASLTSEPDIHPNFVRVVPNDDIQIDVMIETMVQLDWNRIAIVHENNVYGAHGATNLKTMAEKRGLCIAMVKAMDVTHGIDTQQLTDIIQAIQTEQITGVVLFGSALSVQGFYSALGIYSNVPIMMISEGFNMDIRVFETGSGHPAPRAKGSLALSPFYQTVTEFDTYWRAMFKDSTILASEIATNPWLLHVYYAITDCEAKNCQVSNVTDQQMNNFFSNQYMYIQYAILGAHVLAKLATEEHSRHCPNSNGICPEFLANFQPSDIVTRVKTSPTFDIRNDFNWSPASLATRGPFTLGDTGDIVFPQNQPIYQLYNYRVTVNGAFGLVKVGELEGGTFTLDKIVMRDYTEAGTKEHSWPDVRKAQCPVNNECSSCINMEELHEALIIDEGDAYVIGTNPIFSSQGIKSCGDISITNSYQVMEAIRFAVSKMNDDTNHFKNTKIGFIGISSCNNAAVIQRKVYELFTNGVTLRNGTRLRLNGNVIGFVGDVGSSISISIAETLKRLQYVQISYASTSPLLSDRTAYPYFLRVVTPDDEQAKAMIAVLRRLNSTFIQLVHSEGAYGEGGKEKVHEAAYENDICVKQSIAVNDGNLNSVYDKLRRYPDAMIVIVFLRSHHVVPFTKEIVKQMIRPGEFVFIGSEAWSKNPGVLDADNAQQYMLGSLTVVLEMAQNSELRTHILNLEPQPFHENPWSLLYLQEARNCYFSNSFDKTKPELCDSTNGLDSSGTFVVNTWATSAFVAATSLLKGADAHFKQVCGSTAVHLCDQFNQDKEGFIASLKKVELDIEGTGDYIRVFDNNGNGNVGYRIYNIKHEEGNPQKLAYKEVGRYPLEGTFTFETDKVYLRPDFLSICPNPQACAGCVKEKVPDGDGAKTEKTSLNAGVVALGVLFGIAFLVALVLAIVIFLIRRQPVDDTYIHARTLDTGHSGSGGSDSMVPSSVRPHAVGQADFPTAVPCSAGSLTVESGIFHEIKTETDNPETTDQSNF